MDLPALNLKDVFRSLGKQTVYLTLTLLSGIFIVFSIIYDRYILFGIMVFLYAIVGVFWRFCIKDLQDLYPNAKKQLTIIFHIGNFDLLAILLYCLEHILLATIFV